MRAGRRIQSARIDPGPGRDTLKESAMPLPRTRHLKPILAVVAVAVVVGSLVDFRATQSR